MMTFLITPNQQKKKVSSSIQTLAFTKTRNYEKLQNEKRNAIAQLNYFKHNLDILLH